MNISFDVLSKMPFPGLRSFEPSEGEVFFGRDRQLDELLRKIRSNRFLAVVGNAGSGKSSIVKASLVPKLKEGFAGQAGPNWRVAICKPGNNPIGNLANQLAQRNVLHGDSKMDPNFPSVIETTLNRGSMGIVEAFKQANLGQENLLIIVDQFEEIFRFSKRDHKSAEAAATFVNLLLNASRQREQPIYIVLTMRSNFIGDCTDFRGLPEAINDGQFLIPRMKTEDLKKIILSPIKVTGALVEPELANRIISDIGEDFDDLPTLQHTLMRMWDNWIETDCDPNVPIGLQHYEAVGTIKKALSYHAEEAYAGLKTEEDQVICERLFRALADHSSDGKPVRRPVIVREVMQVTGASLPQVQGVIDLFAKQGRLFLSAPEKADLDEDAVVNITHESLITNWERLALWVAEEKESAETYTRMSAAAALYYGNKGGLWQDPELSLGLKWFDPQKYDADHPDRLAPNKAWSERYNDSYNETTDFLKESEKAQGKKNFALNEDAERKKRTRMLIMYLSLGFGLICLILLMLAGYALEQAYTNANRANKKEREARTQAYLAERAKEDAERNKFIATESEKRSLQEKLLADNAKETALSFSDKAKISAENARSSLLRTNIALDSAISKERLALIREQEAKNAKNLADRNAKEAIDARNDAIKEKGLSLAQSVAVKSWKVEDSDVQGLLAKEAYELNRASNGRSNDAYIYEALYKAVDKLQNVSDNPNFNTLNTPPEGLHHIGAVRSIVVSKSKKDRDLYMYTTGSDGWLLKRKLRTYKDKKEQETDKPDVLARSNDRVFRAMDMSNDGKYIARGGDEDYIEIYDADAKELKYRIDAHRGRRVWALAFLPDGKAIISAGDDNSIKYSNFQGNSTPIVEGLANRVTSLSISGDGQHVAGAGNSPDVTIWNMKSGKDEFTLRNIDEKGTRKTQHATAVAISPQGRFVATGYIDGSILIWDMYEFVSQGEAKYMPIRARNHSAKISSLSFNDEGTMLVVGSLDKRATLWQIWDKKYIDTESHKEFPFKDPKFQPIRLDDQENWVLSTAFNHDGSKVLLGCADGVVKIYEVDLMRYANQICGFISQNLNNSDWKKYIGTDDPESDPRKQQLYIITIDGKRTPMSTCR